MKKINQLNQMYLTMKFNKNNIIIKTSSSIPLIPNTCIGINNKLIKKII